MRALLTGATGFVGQNLSHFLTDKGWEVRSIPREKNSPDSPGPRADIDLVLMAFRPDVVIHLATLFIAEHQAKDIPALIQSNITFGTQVVDAMARNQIKKLVNVGSLWQYFEGQRDNPSCLYAATKSAFEAILKFYVSAHSMQVLNLMLSDTYGPEDPRPKILPKLLRMAGTSETLDLSPGEQVMEWTHIKDIVSAFEVAALRLVKNQEPNTFVHYTATSGEPLTLRETVHLCEKVLNQKINVAFGARLYRQRENMSPSKLDPQLPGWKPRILLEEGLRELSKND